MILSYKEEYIKVADLKCFHRAIGLTFELAFFHLLFFFSYFKVRHFLSWLTVLIVILYILMNVIDLKVTEHHRVGLDQTTIAFRYETLATTRNERI